MNTESNRAASSPEERRIERYRKCRFYDKMYTSYVDYFVHVKHAHKDSQGLVALSQPLPLFKCKQSLLRHCRRRRGIKNYLCSSYDKSFRWRKDLEKHKMVHGPRAKYACHLPKGIHRKMRLAEA